MKIKFIVVFETDSGLDTQEMEESITEMMLDEYNQEISNLSVVSEEVK